MRIKMLLKITAVAVIAAIGGTYMWFSGSSVGLNNYFNKVSVQVALRSPELVTNIGIIDNSLLDFHIHKLHSYAGQS